MPFSGMPIGTIIQIELKPGRVVKLLVQQVLMLNLWVVMVAMHKFGFRRRIAHGAARVYGNYWRSF